MTAALIGLKNRAAVFAVQRAVADFEGEPLMAVLPGVALDELWDVVGAGERALLAMSAMVAVVSLAGLVAVVLAGLNERRRELAVLRAVGAAPRHVLLMLAAEGAAGHAAGRALGVVAVAAAVVALAPWLQSSYGITLTLSAPTRARNGACWAPCWPPASWPAWCRAGAPTGCRWPTGCRRAAEPPASRRGDALHCASESDRMPSQP